MLTRRLQILLDEERYRRLAAVAADRGTSVAAVVREAVDRGLMQPDAQRRAAAARLLEAEDMPVGEPQELRRELEELRARRA
jgi:predicted DNA-binding protein